LTRRALVEIPFVVGTYTMLSMVANALPCRRARTLRRCPLNRDDVYRVVEVARYDCEDCIVSDEAVATFAPAVA
jgi:uncharacterized protein (UPF0179 family)